ncbi:hypothetical protein ABT097_27990 [Streptomyces sp. NPDC002225]|uniref:hypothetical protein n=1 Tax=Streptomyces sp. NPDC002225 TaxID=3154413 RepID=UPI00332CCB44
MTLTGRFAGMLPQQLEASVGEVAAALALPGLVGSADQAAHLRALKALRERQERARALARRTTAALLEAAQDLEALSYCPHHRLARTHHHRLPHRRGAAARNHGGRAGAGT